MLCSDASHICFSLSTDDVKHKLVHMHHGRVFIKLVTLATLSSNTEVQYNSAGTLGQITLIGKYLNWLENTAPFELIQPFPEVTKLFSCSTKLRLKFILLINVKMPTSVGILTFMSRTNYRLWQSEPEISTNFDYFSNYEQFKFHAQLS